MVNRGETQLGIPLNCIFFIRVSVLIHIPLSLTINSSVCRDDRKEGVGTREDVPCEQSPFDLPRKVGKIEETFARRRENIHTIFIQRGYGGVHVYSVKGNTVRGIVFMGINFKLRHLLRSSSKYEFSVLTLLHSFYCQF